MTTIADLLMVFIEYMHHYEFGYNNDHMTDFRSTAVHRLFALPKFFSIINSGHLTNQDTSSIRTPSLYSPDDVIIKADL